MQRPQGQRRGKDAEEGSSDAGGRAPEIAMRTDRSSSDAEDPGDAGEWRRQWKRQVRKWKERIV